MMDALTVLERADLRVGIGVITFNRRDQVLDTLTHLVGHTKSPVTLIVADDGSTDGTSDAVARHFPQAVLVNGSNRGAAWNRNRVLWMAHHECRCDVSILMEDDAHPTENGWEQAWIDAAVRFGHVNLDGEWFADGRLSGSGTVDDPVVSQGVSGQVSAFSLDALRHVGFYDSTFRGYGMGHVEHTLRLVRAGYGGVVRRGHAGEFDRWQRREEGVFPPNEPPEAAFYLLSSPIKVSFEHSFRDAVSEQRSIAHMAKTVTEQVYRSPWACDGDMMIFRNEMRAARGRYRRQQAEHHHRQMVRSLHDALRSAELSKSFARAGEAP